MNDGPVILFDGVCNFCNASVQFVLRHEAEPRFRFAALQSEVGQALARRHHIDVDSIVLIDGERVFVRSAAAVRISARLRMPARLLALLWIVPWPLRDLGYAAFARVRYSIFGKRDACMVPTPDVRARFLDGTFDSSLGGAVAGG